MADSAPCSPHVLDMSGSLLLLQLGDEHWGRWGASLGCRHTAPFVRVAESHGQRAWGRGETGGSVITGCECPVPVARRFSHGNEQEGGWEDGHMVWVQNSGSSPGSVADML